MPFERVIAPAGRGEVPPVKNALENFVHSSRPRGKYVANWTFVSHAIHADKTVAILSYVYVSVFYDVGQSAALPKT